MRSSIGNTIIKIHNLNLHTNFDRAMFGCSLKQYSGKWKPCQANFDSVSIEIVHGTFQTDEALWKTVRAGNGAIVYYLRIFKLPKKSEIFHLQLSIHIL